MPEWAWRALWDLSDAGDFDGIIALLQTLITNDSITKAEAADFFDRLVADIEEKAPELDPDSKAYLEAYTSEKDLADRISYLLRQGIIPDEATAGAFYNRVLGITADRKELDALEANRFAPPEALEAAQKRYEAAQAALNQEAGMFIRAGTARGEAATAKEEARQRAERIAGINYVNKLNAGVQADYEEELAKAEEAQLKARFDAPYIEANKREYLPPLRAVLATAVRAGAMTQEQADSQFNSESSLIDRGFSLRDLPNYNQVLVERENEETRRLVNLQQINLAPRIKEANRQLALSELFGRSEKAGLERLLKERQWQAGQPELLPEPSYASVYEPFLAGIGAPNFRRFIESRLGRIAEQTEGARAAWWRARNPLQPMPEQEPAVPTFESLLTGARADVGERGDILRQAQLGASTGAQQDYYLGQLPYATEQKGLSETRLADLLALGQEGYFAQQRALPRDEPLIQKRALTTAPDPFKTAIEAYPFLEEFMKLGPTERGYQKQRFAPRVSFRF